MNDVLRHFQIGLADLEDARVNQIKTETVRQLIAAIDKNDQAVIVVGPIVIVKFDGTIIARSTDADVAARIERTKDLLSDPCAVAKIIWNTDRPSATSGVLGRPKDDHEYPAGENEPPEPTGEPHA